MSNLFYKFPDGSIVDWKYISFIEGEVQSLRDWAAFTFDTSGGKTKQIEFNGSDAEEVAAKELDKFKKWYTDE